MCLQVLFERCDVLSSSDQGCNLIPPGRSREGSRNLIMILVIFAHKCVHNQIFFSIAPHSTQSIHCFPLSSTSVSCSWTPPESDFDSYVVECHKQSSRMPVYTYKLGHDALSQHFDRLEPFRNYTIYITVMSGDKQSSTTKTRVITMIDSK